MNNCENYKTYNHNLQSSLKYMNFQGYTKDQIIAKYESLIPQREKQINDLVIQTSAMKSKLEEVMEKKQEINKENDDFENSLIEKNTFLKRLLDKKAIMFNEIDSLINEIDGLKKRYNENITYSRENNMKDKENSKKRKSSLSVDKVKKDYFDNQKIKHEENQSKSTLNVITDNGIVKDNLITTNVLQHNSNKTDESPNKKKKKSKKHTKKKLDSDLLYYEPVFK